jgi:carboxypeptidase Taq
MTMDPQLFESLSQQARQAAIYQSAADALEWDERTGLPPAAGAYRAEQISTLRAAAHQLRTASQYGDQLQRLAEQCGSLEAHDERTSTVRGLKRDHERDRKLPTELVSRLSTATVRGQQVWDRARREDSFSQFEPTLGEILALKREAGARLAEGGSQSAYEALMDEYEPDARVDELVPVFAALKDKLTALIGEIRDAPRQPDTARLRQSFPVSAQRCFSQQLAQWVGFDFQRGRLDETSHPFCTTLGPEDCRILTRFDEHWFPGGLYGTLHEAGHGMYEQGLKPDWFGLPPGTCVSLGIHESQSRLWENQVGRSREFWQWLLPKAMEQFPAPLRGVDLDELHFAVNEVRPSLIRVEADEATYNLHILIRFELERALIGGDLAVSDLPNAWNEQYRQALGIEPPSDADGVLQDVHWSAGLFGYFPTYTLGNLIAAQLFGAASRQLGDLPGQIARGQFGGLLDWLRQQIHQHGRCYSGAELVENATGEPLRADHLTNDLEAKLRPLYGI